MAAGNIALYNGPQRRAILIGAVHHQLGPAIGERAPASSKVRRHLRHIFERSDVAFHKRNAGYARLGPQIEIIDRRADRPHRDRKEGRVQGIGYGFGYFILHQENILKSTVIMIGPQVGLRARINQMRRNPHPAI